MEIKGKVHCFFEQSGTFKNEFIKLGIPAEDYDIQNNFGETDHVIDLFEEIEKGYAGEPSLFDRISKDDLILAFFPCIKFCNIAEYNQRLAQEAWRKHGVDYTNYFWFMRPQIIDMDRTQRGDWFKKPTAYWFVGCEPTHRCTMQQTKEKDRKRVGMTSQWRDKDSNKVYAKGSSKAGLCSEERSLISPDYARNWICDFILGKSQPEIDPCLF